MEEFDIGFDFEQHYYTFFHKYTFAPKNLQILTDAGIFYQFADQLYRQVGYDVITDVGFNPSFPTYVVERGVSYIFDGTVAVLASRKSHSLAKFGERFFCCTMSLDGASGILTLMPSIEARLDICGKLLGGFVDTDHHFAARTLTIISVKKKVLAQPHEQTYQKSFTVLDNVNVTAQISFYFDKLYDQVASDLTIFATFAEDAPSSKMLAAHKLFNNMRYLTETVDKLLADSQVNP